MIDAARLRHLQAMGIDVWVPRERQSSPAEEPVGSPDAAPPARTPQTLHAGGVGPRVRLEAGTGDWLLVVDERDRATHETLLGDIRAAIGIDRCRFGSWSDTAESGVAAAEWNDHGIVHALVFDRRDDLPGDCVRARPLGELAGSADARRGLWHLLRERIGG